MPVQTFVTSNTTNIVNGGTVAITGRNGFSTRSALIPLLVNTEPEKINVVGNASNIKLTINELSSVFDDNFLSHVLDVIDGSFQGLKGTNIIAVPIVEKISSGIQEGFVGFNQDTFDFSFEILSFDLNNNEIVIDNTKTLGTELIDVLASAPFYVKINQVLDTRFTNNWIYLSGHFKEFERIYNVEGQIGSNTFSLGIIPKEKEFITIYKNNEKLLQSDFSFTANTANVVFTVPVGIKTLRTIVNHYTVPIIEIGDNATLSFGSDSIYSIAETTYDTSSPSYNAFLTANCIFKVKLEENLRSNLSGALFTNISPDLLQATINNVNTAINTFTVDYSNTFLGSFNLSNHKVYSMVSGLGYNPITIGKDRIISDVPFGTNYVRARSVNSLGRRSPFVTKTITFKEFLIGQVSNLSIQEHLFRDTSLGIIVNAEISFTALVGQDITKYELAHKITSEEEVSASSSFNTVDIPASEIEADGKIRFTVYNVERGRAAGVNTLTVEVTPVSSTNRRGITATKSQLILGKTARPQNIENITGGQTGNNLLLSWDIPIDSNGNFIDIDLLEIVIRRTPGIIAVVDLPAKWIQGKSITRVASPAASVIVPIQNYGTFTYMFKTRDTSSNFSDSVIGFTITTSRPSTDAVINQYSESDPDGNVVSNLPNDNAGENNYPSFADSNNFGFSGDIMSAVDNANGTSSGFAVLGEATDLFVAANSIYQTQVRDIGLSIDGTLLSLYEGFQTTRTTFNDFRSNVTDSIAEAGSNSTILFDTSNSGIGDTLANTTYNVKLGTLSSGGPTGNIFAIWNAGQFTSDNANTNSFSLIAGVINSDAIALGETFFANGERTFTNVFANLTTSIAYQLVDLIQFDDNSDDVFFEGRDKITDVTEEFRFSTNDPFYANSNVNSAVFVSAATDSDGWRIYSPTKQAFQWFQFKYTLINKNPQEADYTLDDLNYTVELARRTFTAEVNVTVNPTTVDYTPTNFKSTPIITITADSSIGITSTYSNATSSQTEIRTFYTANGDPVTGIIVSVNAEGI